MTMQLYELSQVPVHLRYIGQKRNLLQAFGTQVLSANKAAAGRLMEGVFELDAMDRLARAHLARHLDFTLANRAVALLRGGLFGTLLAREAAAASPLEKAALRAYLQDPGPTASAERIEILYDVDELALTTEWMSAFQEQLTAAMVACLAGCEEDMSQDESAAAIVTLRQQAEGYRASHPGLLFLQFAYRDVSTEDLARYRQALRSPEAGWLMATARGALMAGVKPSLERFAANVVALL